MSGSDSSGPTPPSSLPTSRPASLGQSGDSSASLELPSQVSPVSPSLSQRTIRFSLNSSPSHTSGLSSSGSTQSLHRQSQSSRSPPSAVSRQTGGSDHMLRQRVTSSSALAPQMKRYSSSRSILTGCIRKPYPSTKLEGEIEKPWMRYPDPAHRWGRIIFWTIVALGFVGAGAIVALGYMSILTPGKLCMVMDDDFSQGINPEYWSHEVRVDGYGNKQFEWTTADSANSFVADNTLYLVPTLTADSIGADAITNGYTLNLTADGRCTGVNQTQCVAVSNSTRGTIINPVQGSRLVTKGKASIRYGKIEVEARMATGDWIWPAIWMMPEDDKYGEWPRSGEIDIIESRGNNQSYSSKGQDYVQSALHWGPNSMFDSYWRTFGIRQRKVDGYAKKFNKFTLEWTDKYLTTYVNNRAYSVMDIRFDRTFWQRGAYPNYYVNNTETLPLTNPWYSSANTNAPFDQSFYLILNVAVGGTNGYFPDNMGQKPWLDSSLNAMSDFWAAKDRWYPTWPQDPKERGMAVKSVKMWRQC